MTLRRRSRRGAGPAPSKAGANLLVHDLKNLAGRLSVLLQNLQERYDDPVFKRSAFSVIDDTASHLRRLAGELLQHEGRLLVKLLVDPSDILRQSVADARAGAPAGVEFRERYAPVPQLWGDAFLMRRAFSCAIENALEAMEGRGTVSVGARATRRDGRARIVIEIADDGPGMSDDFLRAKLRRPFSSTKEEGLGLGVYTMRQVAELHGGTMRIASAEGRGTRVRFHLPAGTE